MFVCLCNAYRDAEIREAARFGARRDNNPPKDAYAKDAYAALGRGPRCGRCLAFAQGLIDEVHRGADGSAPPAPANLSASRACSAGAA